MTISRVAYASSGGAFGLSSFTVSDPLYAGDGVLSLAMYFAWGDGATLASPWVNLIDHDFWPQNYGGHARQQLWWQPNGVGSVTFQNTDGAGVDARGVLMTFAGVDTSGPADYDAGSVEFPTTPDIDAPSVTVAADHSALVTGHCAMNHGIGGNRYWLPPPTGMSMVDANYGTPTLLFQVDEDLNVASGASGVKTASFNDLTQMWGLCGMSVVLTPVPDSGGGGGWRLGLAFAG